MWALREKADTAWQVEVDLSLICLWVANGSCNGGETGCKLRYLCLGMCESPQRKSSKLRRLFCAGKQLPTSWKGLFPPASCRHSVTTTPPTSPHLFEPTLPSGCWWWFPPDCCFSASSPTKSPGLFGHGPVCEDGCIIDLKKKKATATTNHFKSRKMCKAPWLTSVRLCLYLCATALSLLPSMPQAYVIVWIFLWLIWLC